MPLTNAQKQKDTRARRKAKLERLARLEGVLREIANSGHTGWPDGDAERIAYVVRTARQALGDVG